MAASGVLSAVSFAGLVVTGSSVGGPGAVGTFITLGVLLVLAAVVVLVFRRPGTATAVADRAAALVRIVRRDPERARVAARRFTADLRAIRPRRLESAGGTLRTGVRVDRVLVTDGRATGVRTEDGETIRARAVLADVDAPTLYRRLVPAQHLPPRLLRDLARFDWDNPTMTLDWALGEPVPWSAPGARDAGTVHLGVDMNGLTRYAGDLATTTTPEEPFILFGQMTTADATRSPAGTESAWAYTHLPRGFDNDADEIAAHAERVQAIVERHAPGFGDTVVARQIQTPADLAGADSNLVEGALGAGTSNIHQQLFFRPVPGLGRAETVVDGLYLAGASAHPGPGVQGGPGSNAARAALSRATRTGALRRRVIDAAFAKIYA